MKLTTLFALLPVLGCIGCATMQNASSDRPLASADCDSLTELRSQVGDEKYTIEFKNSRPNPVRMYWIDYDGKEVFKGNISPGESLFQVTYISHPWVVRDKDEECIAAFKGKSIFQIDIK